MKRMFTFGLLGLALALLACSGNKQGAQDNGASQETTDLTAAAQKTEPPPAPKEVDNTDFETAPPPPEVYTAITTNRTEITAAAEPKQYTAATTSSLQVERYNQATTVANSTIQAQPYQGSQNQNVAATTYALPAQAIEKENNVGVFVQGQNFNKTSTATATSDNKSNNTVTEENDNKTVTQKDNPTTSQNKTATSATVANKVLCSMTDGTQGIPVWKTPNGFKSISESQCRIFAAGADFTLSSCSTDLQACIDQTAGPLEERMEQSINSKNPADSSGCEAFSVINPSHPVKDRYCCTPTAFSSILHDVSQSSVSLAFQRDFQADCFP